jgi:hypothetical protein
MKYFIKRSEAEAYPNGMHFIHNITCTEYIIEKQCGCGDWLHYECSQIGRFDKYGMVWQHLDIERHCEVKLNVSK